MSADSLQRNGRSAYDKGDYTKALEYYNRAVGRGDPSIKLLDSVSATHIKLGALDAALTTAKKIINAGREDATGYMRAGQILMKMGKESTALEIYAYGLKSIKHVGTGFEKLKKLHTDLQQQLAPKNSIDPLTVLPRELAIAVLEYLSFRQRIAVCRVSPGWTKFIQSEPTLWSHLDLSGAKKKVRNSFVSTAINTARNKITKATLHRVTDFDKVLSALVKCCSLESLKLVETGLQGGNLVEALKKADKLKEFIVCPGTYMSPSTLSKVIEGRHSTIEMLSFESQQESSIYSELPRMPRLKSLDLRVVMLNEAQEMLDHIAETSPSLESLTLRATRNLIDPRIPFPLSHDLRPCASLTHVDIDMKSGLVMDGLLLPTSVKNLRLAADTGLTLRELHTGTDHLPWDLPLLEEVELDAPDASFSFVTEFVSKAKGDRNLSSLKSFRLLRAVIETDNDFGLPPRLRGLQHFGIPGCIDLKDTHVDILLRDAQKLESMDLTGTSITGVAVKSVVKAGHVKNLVINKCHQVGRDAVDWARSSGLQIEAKDMNKF